jgi:peptidoglycan-associated lipoprotein
MKWLLVGVSAAALVQLYTPRADACGIYMVHPQNPPHQRLHAMAAKAHRPAINAKQARIPTTTATTSVVPDPPVVPPPVLVTPPTITDLPALHDEVFFGLGSTRLGDKTSLDRDVKWLETNSGASVVVEGFADPSGNHDDNMALGQKRAEAVRDFLVGSGIATSRIEVHSLGDTVLKYGRTDPRNRRATVEPKH